MKLQVHDYPTRFLVTSESDERDSYLVDLTDYKIGEVFNGSCTCPHFQYQLKKRLTEPSNKFNYRCKHIKAARDNALDFLLPYLKAADPNTNEDNQP